MKRSKQHTQEGYELQATDSDTEDDDPHSWSVGEVKSWFRRFEGGRFADLAPLFSTCNGGDLCQLSERQMSNMVPGAQGFALFNALHRTMERSGRHSGRLLKSIDVQKPKPKLTIDFPPIIVRPPLWLVLCTIVFATLCVLALTIWKKDLETWCYRDMCLTCGSRDCKINETIWDGSICKDVTTQTTDPSAVWYATTLIKFGSIPMISVGFTYCHIWLALWLTFYPLEFIGILRLPDTNLGLPGWQGIIPSKADKMARTSVRLMTEQLLDVKKEFGKLSGEHFAGEVESVVNKSMMEIIHRLAMKYKPGLWERLPEGAKDELVRAANAKSPQIVMAMIDDMKENIEAIFDVEEFAVSAMVKNKEMLNYMFIQVLVGSLVGSGFFCRSTGIAWFGIVWFGIVWYWYSLVWYGIVWFGIVWFGIVWFGHGHQVCVLMLPVINSGLGSV
jgi:hypothetical protein